MSSLYHLALLPEARDDLIRLRQFIHEHNPAAAARAAQTIRDGMEHLRRFPLLGHAVEDMDISELRDLFIPFGRAGYWVRYLVKEHEIIVTNIWHSREEPFNS
jgi:plasmid stabilization system protein ParE